MEQSEGKARAIVDSVKPEIDGGRFPAKRVIGEKVVVEADNQTMQGWMKTLESSQVSQSKKVELALSEEVAAVMDKYADRQFAVTYPKELAVSAERTKARFSTRYEMFPRSCANEPGKHGTSKDCEARPRSIRTFTRLISRPTTSSAQEYTSFYP